MCGAVWLWLRLRLPVRLQTLLLYGALLHSSVNMVMLWITLAPLLVDMALGAALHGRPVAPQLLPMVAAAAAAGGAPRVCTLTDTHACVR